MDFASGNFNLLKKIISKTFFAARFRHILKETNRSERILEKMEAVDLDISYNGNADGKHLLYAEQP